MYRVLTAATVHGPMGKMTDWQEQDCDTFAEALCHALALVAADKQTIVKADTNPDAETARIDCECQFEGLRYTLVIRISAI